VLVALVALLPKRSDDISERAEALIDILRLPQTILVPPSAARVEPLAAGEVDEVQRALTHLAGVRVGAADAQSEDRVRTRGALVHQRRRNRTSRVCRREQRADLCGRAERLDYDVRDARRTPFLVLDLVLLFVEFAFSEEVIDGFVVLWFGLKVLYLCTQMDYVRSQETGLPGCIPNPCFSVLQSLGKLDLQHVVSCPRSPLSFMTACSVI
jgi:hypothetical protein